MDSMETSKCERERKSLRVQLVRVTLARRLAADKCPPINCVEGVHAESCDYDSFSFTALPSRRLYFSYVHHI